MSDSPRWSYVQARLQARHGERLQEADWRAIEAARSIDQFIERAHASPLRRFTERVHARTSSHAIERILRDAWRSYVTEVAGWVPAAWRQAVIWTSHVPDLPIIDALLRGEAPKWIRQDPVFAGLTETDLRKRSAALTNSLFNAIVVSGAREKHSRRAGIRIGARCGRSTAWLVTRVRSLISPRRSMHTSNESTMPACRKRALPIAAI